jgi:Glycosyl-hydrolase 97 N-terminal
MSADHPGHTSDNSAEISGIFLTLGRGNGTRSAKLTRNESNCRTKYCMRVVCSSFPKFVPSTLIHSTIQVSCVCLQSERFPLEEVTKMRIVGKKLLLLLVPVLLLGTLSAQPSYDLRSPDNAIEVRVRTVGEIRYDLVLNGRAVLEDATLSLDVEHKRLGIEPKVLDAKQRSYDQTVVPVVRQKFAKIRDHYNELRLSFDGSYAVVFRAYNEGLALNVVQLASTG